MQVIQNPVLMRQHAPSLRRQDSPFSVLYDQFELNPAPFITLNRPNAPFALLGSVPKFCLNYTADGLLRPKFKHIIGEGQISACYRYTCSSTYFGNDPYHLGTGVIL